MNDMGCDFDAMEGIFAEEDIGASLEVLRKKADAGDAKSQFYLGNGIYMKFFMDNYGKSINEYGRELKDDVNEEVIKWMIKSANQGYALAQYSLSSIFGDEDRCDEVDYVQGLMWAILAATNSHENVDETISEYINNCKINEEEISRAKVLAREWQSA